MKNILYDIEQAVKEIEGQNLLLYGNGYCFAMAEVTQAQLTSKGIGSRLVECQLTAIKTDPPQMKLVGHGRLSSDNNNFDSHMVCVTETDPPYLIDLSLGECIILETQEDDGMIIATKEDAVTKIIYRQKLKPTVPAALNQNIVARIRADQDLRSSVRWLKILLIVALTISTINATRGFYDYYRTYMVEDSRWGPNQQVRLEDRLDNLEKLIKENPKK